MSGSWGLRGSQIRADDGRGQHIATYQTCRADGLLLAAAPDLLTALRDTLNVLKYAEIIDGTLHAQFMPSDLEQMRAAIAKAEGHS